jgi:hypothetical protein
VEPVALLPAWLTMLLISNTALFAIYLPDNAAALSVA